MYNTCKSNVAAVVSANGTGVLAEGAIVVQGALASLRLVTGTQELLVPFVLEALLLHRSIVAFGAENSRQWMNKMPNILITL